MRLRRMIVMLTVACGLSLGLSQAVSPAYAASAAPAKAAAVSTAQAGGGTVSATGSAIPNIKINPSCTGSTTWVLIFEFSIPTRGVNHWCFGYTGTWYFPTSGSLDYASYFCAGNNRGTLHVRYPRGPNGQSRTYSFGPGTHISWSFNEPAQLVKSHHHRVVRQ